MLFLVAQLQLIIETDSIHITAILEFTRALGGSMLKLCIPEADTISHPVVHGFASAQKDMDRVPARSFVEI